MLPTEIESVIAQSFQELERTGTNRYKPDLAAYAATIGGEMAAVPFLLEMAGDPFLCRLLCIYYGQLSNGHFPSSRSEAYQACSDTLTSPANPSNEAMVGYPALGNLQVQALLDDLAHWMLQHTPLGVSMLTGHVDERLSAKLGDIVGLSPGITGQGVRRLFVERLGILDEVPVHRLAFASRPLQAYFAARAALEPRQIAFLVASAHQDQGLRWRDVTLLAAELATRELGAQLLTGLLDRADTEPRQQALLYGLVSTCLQRVTDLPVSIRAVIGARLESFTSYPERGSEHGDAR